MTAPFRPTPPPFPPYYSRQHSQYYPPPPPPPPSASSVSSFYPEYPYRGAAGQDPLRMYESPPASSQLPSTMPPPPPPSYYHTTPTAAYPAASWMPSYPAANTPNRTAATPPPPPSLATPPASPMRKAPKLVTPEYTSRVKKDGRDAAAAIPVYDDDDENRQACTSPDAWGRPDPQEQHMHKHQSSTMTPASGEIIYLLDPNQNGKLCPYRVQYTTYVMPESQAKEFVQQRPCHYYGHTPPRQYYGQHNHVHHEPEKHDVRGSFHSTSKAHQHRSTSPSSSSSATTISSAAFSATRSVPPMISVPVHTSNPSSRTKR